MSRAALLFCGVDARPVPLTRKCAVVLGAIRRAQAVRSTPKCAMLILLLLGVVTLRSPRVLANEPIVLGSASVSRGLGTAAGNGLYARMPSAQPVLTLAIVADPTTFGRVGQVVSYSFRVTNAGNVPVSALSVTNTRVIGIACPVTSLPAGAGTTCTAVETTTGADVLAGRIVATTTVIGVSVAGTAAAGPVATAVLLAPNAIRQATQNAIRSLTDPRASVITSASPGAPRVHRGLTGDLSGNGATEADGNEERRRWPAEAARPEENRPINSTVFGPVPFFGGPFGSSVQRPRFYGWADGGASSLGNDMGGMGNRSFAALQFRPSAEIAYFREAQIARENPISIPIPAQLLTGIAVDQAALRGIAGAGVKSRPPSGLASGASAAHDGIGATTFRAIEGVHRW